MEFEPIWAARVLVKKILTYLLTYYVSDTDGCSNRATILVLEFDFFAFFTFPGTLGAAKPPIQAFRLQKSVQKHHIYGHLGDSIIPQAFLRQRRIIGNLKSILKIDNCIFFTLPGIPGVRKPPNQAFRLLKSAQKQLIYAWRGGPILVSVLTIQWNFFVFFWWLNLLMCGKDCFSSFWAKNFMDVHGTSLSLAYSFCNQSHLLLCK